MSVGNYEWYFNDEDERFFIDHDITVLDNADVQVTIKGKKMQIGELSTRFDLVGGVCTKRRNENSSVLSSRAL